MEQYFTEAAEREKKLIKKVLMISIPVMICLTTFFILLGTVIIPKFNYFKANDLYDSGRFDEAITAFEKLDGYKDSKAKLISCQTAIKNEKYNAALSLYNSGRFDEAIAAFEDLSGYKDSVSQISACQAAIKDEKYNAAISLYNTGKYSEAITAFEGLNGYKESSAYASNALIQKSGLTNASVGSTVKFGTYEQDNNISNGKEEIEWQVLAKDGTKVLVISKYALDFMPYNTEYASITWENCSLNTWLNGTFYNSSFDATEQAMIVNTTVSADRNPNYAANPGKDTNNNIFILSITEATLYLGGEETMKCRYTAYAEIQSAYASCSWWMRSPGHDLYSAAYVREDGSICGYGNSVSHSTGAVRPAMWIDLAS